MKKTCLFLAAFCILLSGRVSAEQIVFTSTGSYPPFSFKEGRQMSGINVEIIREALRRAGHEPVYKVMPFKRGLHALKEGKVAGYPGLFHTEERSEFLNYCAEPLCSVKIGIFVLRGSGLKVGGLEDLSGKSVAVMRNYAYGSEFDRHRGCECSPPESKIQKGLLSGLSLRRVHPHTQNTDCQGFTCLSFQA
ncbi:ABC transporter substrate-binding protein [Desulfonema ishimotonii]|uniref:ABC transporter substrate-binding protein n=1 Tax=Desulfonema ishimotonii TaxID=45657 RepID=A0A401FWP8_9BACT|nr:transporter substrate-binding domain-containing protein [Desulfonema ishimotonii]GBC61386.1 ABC transporter substrate-binding protein [Desulfonema ishimotonii]